MSISLDAVASRHLWHMQDIGRLWELHARQSGSPVYVSILLDVPAAPPDQDRSVVHVFPAAPVRDQSFLGRALETYASTGRRDAAPRGPQVDLATRVLPPAIGAPPDPLSQEGPPGTPSLTNEASGLVAGPSQPLLGMAAARAGAHNDEFGLRRFQAAWHLDRPITFLDVEHLCPQIPFLEDDYVPSYAEQRIVRVDASVVDAFLETINVPTLSAVTWDAMNSLVNCARQFIDQRSYQKPWYLLGPAELSEIQYVCNHGGQDQSSLSVPSMATKAGGVSGKERAFTMAVLSALSPFWRMVVLAHSLFRPGRQTRRVKKSVGTGRRRQKKLDDAGQPPTKKQRNEGQSDEDLDAALKKDGPPPSNGPRAMDLKTWLEAPGLDVEDRPITDANLRGACGWFWQHRPQPGPDCLPLLSYKTLGDLARRRPEQGLLRETPGSFGRLENVPGDNDCFYHVIALGLMDRLDAFPNLRKSPFWMEVGVHPGLLRWGVAAFQKAMLGSGPLSHLFPAWLGLTCPGQAYPDPQVAQAVLRKAILECEGERSWMGSNHGEYAVLTDILGVIVRVFSPIGCSPDGTMSQAPVRQDPSLFSVAGAGLDIVGQAGSRRSLLRPGNDVVQLKPSCVHVPLRCVVQAQLEVQSSGGYSDAPVLNMRAKEIALSSSCLVLGVVHDGSSHFMYPRVYPRLFTDHTGVTLPAFNLIGGQASL